MLNVNIKLVQYDSLKSGLEFLIKIFNLKFGGKDKCWGGGEVAI